MNDEARVHDLPFDRQVCADVCLLLEGTYPYVRGGVSTWVGQIIRSLPELTFSIVFLGGRDIDYGKPAYELPANVVHVEVHFLLGSNDAAEDTPASLGRRLARGLAGGLRSGLTSELIGRSGGRGEEARRFSANTRLHTQLRDGGKDGKSEVDKCSVAGFTDLLTASRRITADDLASHELAWETIREKYNEAPPGLDFNHFFWTVRSMHEPLFTLGRIAADPPQATIYHAVSTGYAGWLGAMLANRTGVPYLISEHGIYTKERELDLAQVDWIPDDVDPFHVGLDDGMSYLRQVWIRFFRSLGRMSYASATEIFTLYEGNRVRQIADGAPEEKLSIIPNGVDVARFGMVRRPADRAVPPVLALIGRVVPIKDIKTFIRAMRVIRSHLPEAEGWLVGPEDEDPGYTEECRRLVESLGLVECVKFLGFGKPEEVFPIIGLNVLTSVSEGQPLTVLEGFAAGVPALTTDVGSCRELVLGNGQADRELGAAGAVVPIRDPAAFAAAAIGLLEDGAAWLRASHAGIARVETLYDERDMIARYRDVYAASVASDDCAGTVTDNWREAS